jgi:hypothetical protein
VAIANGYCTAPQVREQVGDPGSNVSDALIERAINTASRAIEKHCGRRFWLDATATARDYRPRETDLALVDDIGSPSGLTVATDVSGAGTFSEAWAASDYALAPSAQDDGSAWSWWCLTAIGTRALPVSPVRATLRVTALWGWSAVPDDVTEACIIKASALLARRTAPLGIAGFDGFGPVRISRFGDPDIMGLLAPFQRVSKPDR